MLSEQIKKQYKIGGTIIVMFYFVCFGFLVIHNFQVWTLSPFVESLIGVLMGAGAIVVITGIMLIFQSSIQAEQEKKQEVFKEKMKLYSLIIDKMEAISKDNIVSEAEDKELISILAKIGLLSNQNTYDQFTYFVSNLKDEENKISENYSSLMLEFIGSARDDLEVQETMTDKQKMELKGTREKSKEVAKRLSYQRTAFNDVESMIKAKYGKKTGYGNTKKLLRYIDKFLEENRSQNITFGYSPTNGISVKKDGRNHLVIKAGKSFVRMHTPSKDGKVLEDYGIEVEYSESWNDYYVGFKELSKFKQCQDKIVNYINS